MTLFPAHAGVIPKHEKEVSRYDSFPRPRGGDPLSGNNWPGSTCFFPAHAGVILTSRRLLGPIQAFPRPRGGDPNSRARSAGKRSFSPPMRG